MYQLGEDFILHPDQREFFVTGQRVDLGVRGFELLLRLVEHRERTLRKNEIFRLVWGQQIVVEDNLYVQVSKLRGILGKQSILTIPGQGYRFVMRTTLVNKGEHDDPANSSDPAPQPDNLRDDPPAQRQSLIGRTRELSEVRGFLDQHRLVTLAGPGGIGKTSLAMVAMKERQQPSHRDLVMVDLSLIDADTSALQSLTRALQIPFAPGAAGLELACTALEERRALLLLDNAEHVLPQVRELVRAIRASTREVGICVTSRVPLRLDGEMVYRVPSLAMPSDSAADLDALRYGAVELFVHAAQEGFSNFQLDQANIHLVADICRRLDGLPLALKLAARRLPALGIKELHSRLSSMTNLLAQRLQVRDHRHETIAATLAWSFDALDEGSQDLLQTCGVFSGSFALTQACAIGRSAGLDEWQVIDGLDVLIDHSLVFLIEGTESRYRLLELTRAFVTDKLRQSGRLEQRQKAHAEVMDDALAQGSKDFWELSETALQQRYYAGIENARSAIAWCLKSDASRAVSLCASWFRVYGGLLEAMPETRKYFDDVAPLMGASVAAPMQAAFWLTRAASLIRVNDERVLDYSGRAAILFEAVGDQKGLFESRAWHAASLACNLAEAQAMVDGFERMNMSDWPTRLKMLVHYAACVVHQRQGRFVEALQANDRMLQYARIAGATSWMERGVFIHHCCLLLSGDVDAAIAAAESAVPPPGIAPSTMGQLLTITYAVSQILRGRLPIARLKLEEFIHLCRAHGRPWAAPGPVVFAFLLSAEGRWSDAALIIGYMNRPEQRSEGEMPIARHVMGIIRRDLQAHLSGPELDRLLAAGGQLTDTEIERLVMA